MIASGCVWSTCARRDERVQQRLDRRPWLVGRERAAEQVVDHRRVVHRLALAQRQRPRRAAARRSPRGVIVARSVPEPLTQSDARLAAGVVERSSPSPTCCRRRGSRARGRRRAGSSGRRAPRAAEAGRGRRVPAILRGRDAAQAVGEAGHPTASSFGRPAGGFPRPDGRSFPWTGINGDDVDARGAPRLDLRSGAESVTIPVSSSTETKASSALLVPLGAVEDAVHLLAGVSHLLFDPNLVRIEIHRGRATG